MTPVAAILPCGTRLHLQHGPIDLVIGADGAKSQVRKELSGKTHVPYVFAYHEIIKAPPAPIPPAQIHAT